MKNIYFRYSMVVFVLIFITEIFSQENNLIRDGSFEEEYKWWIFRGNCEVLNDSAHKGNHSLKFSTNNLSEHIAYQYLIQPVKYFETIFWIFPKENSYHFVFEMVANWYKAGADKILNLEFYSDSLKLSSPDQSKIYDNNLRVNQWNKIYICTDSLGFEKHVFINDSLVGSIISNELIPVEAIIVGGLNCRNCFGTVIIDDISITSSSYSIISFSSKNSIFYLNIGFGKSFVGPTLGIGLSFINGGSLYSVRYLTGEEFQFAAGHPTFDTPNLKFKELALLYGRFINIKKLTISLSGGIGFMHARLRGKQLWGRKHEELKISEIGFAVESQFRIVYGDFWGLGITVFANKNDGKSYIGGMIGVQLGKL